MAGLVQPDLVKVLVDRRMAELRAAVQDLSRRCDWLELTAAHPELRDLAGPARNVDVLAGLGRDVND